MKYYAVLDTNVIVSAVLKWNSIPGDVLSCVFSNVIIPIFNEEIIAEYREVLSRPKFHFDALLVKDLIDEIIEKGIPIEASKIDINMPDPKDVVFYEIVMEKRKTNEAYLVTGNIKHFPAKPFIITPKEMIDLILQNLN